MTPPQFSVAGSRQSHGRTSRRRLLALVALAVPVGCWGDVAAAGSTRPIRFVVPNAAGGTSDLLARLFGAQIAETWDQPVIVDLRPGAAGRIAADVVAHSPTSVLLSATDLTPGLPHELQRSATLLPGQWTPAQIFAPTGYTATVTDSPAGMDAFYRLRVGP